MTASIFVSELKNLAPPKEFFLRLGYSSELANERLKQYECILKDEILDTMRPDEVLRLLSLYDCSNVQIGIVSFSKEIQEDDNYFFIGEAECDCLVINKRTYELHVLDHEDPTFKIWNCAANGRNFLEALICAVECFSNRIRNPELAYNLDYTYKTVLSCSSKAGGDRFVDFYKVLLGYDE